MTQTKEQVSEHARNLIDTHAFAELQDYIASLEADAKRLDWLEANWKNVVRRGGQFNHGEALQLNRATGERETVVGWYGYDASGAFLICGTFCELIDAAMPPSTEEVSR